MSQPFDPSGAWLSPPIPRLTLANLGSLNAEQASVSTVNSGILPAMANFPQRDRINSYVEDQIADERVHMMYEAMCYAQRPELRGLTYARDTDIPALMYNSGVAVTNGTHLGLHSYARSSDATPMERFGIISSAGDPFPLLAKMGMETMNIGQGDMLDMEKRYANAAWTEPNMTRGEGDDQASSMKAMKVTAMKAETQSRPRATKMRKRRGRH